MCDAAIRPCELCGAPGIVRVNEFWWCAEHVDEGFRRVARLVAVMKGLAADTGERMIVDALRTVVDNPMSDG